MAFSEKPSESLVPVSPEQKKKKFRRQVAKHVFGFFVLNFIAIYMMWIPEKADCSLEEKQYSGTVRVSSDNKNGNHYLSLGNFLVNCSFSGIGIANCPIKPSVERLKDVGQATAVYRECPSTFGVERLTVELRSNGRVLQGYDRRTMEQDRRNMEDFLGNHVGFYFIVGVFLYTVFDFRSAIRRLREERDAE
ncbi:hypothetical protein [Bordetella ansorpii]|uniref:hypothetical protein n=1 Tax=Bordetella ansorpii TaxID=288768 RepID=UPI0012E90916|nr:hypothetical protein [Bordetella ansorpii]